MIHHCPNCGHAIPLRASPTIKGLTRRQSEVLNFLRQYSATHNGAIPSYDEIKEFCAFASKNGVYRVMHELEDRGHIAITPRRARSATLLGAST